MTRWEKFKEDLTQDQFIDLAAFAECAICPARFFCTNDPKDPDFYEYCEDTFRAWLREEGEQKA